MKKFLLKTITAIVYLLCSYCIVQAQSVRFVHRGIEYEDGATITAYKNNNDLSEIKWSTQLKNYSEKDVNFTLRVEVLENRYNYLDYLNLEINNICFPIDNDTDITLATGETTEDYITTYFSTNYHDSYAKVKYQIFNKENANDVTTIYVIFDIQAAIGATSSVDGIYYNIISSNDVEVTFSSANYNSYSGTTIIPETVIIENTTYNVTAIGDNAFRDCSELVSITIPNSVKSIGKNAFYGCSRLQEIHCNASTPPEIYSNTFDSMKSIVLYVPAESVPAYRTALYWNKFYNINIYLVNGIYYNILSSTDVEVTNLNKNIYSGNIVIPESIVIEGVIYNVTSIADYTFYNCTGLTEVTIGNNVTSIGIQAFEGCSGLREITIPNSVTKIGYSAFYNCYELTEITIGNGVLFIPSDAFAECIGLIKLTIADGNNELDLSGDPFYDCPIETLYLGRNTNLNSYSFYALKSVTIGNSITSIRENAFSNCTNLTDVTIGNSVTTIGDYAFKGCTRLMSATIGNSVTTIGEGVFYGCTELTEIVIPNSVTSIGEGIFYECTGLTEIVIPNSVTSIPNYSFFGCSSLIKITIPNSVTEIGYAAMGSCNNLREIIIPNSVTIIGEYAFNGCAGLTDVTIGNNVTSMGEGVFWNCTGLTNIVIPNGITSIPNYSFYECYSLINVTIPNSVTEIGYAAFAKCESLRDIIIPNNVTIISEFAFQNCDELTEISIPNSVTSIGNAAFSDCDRLIDVTIGNSVTSIGAEAFYGCTGLTMITIPNSATSIGEKAFYGCSGLSRITIGSGVQEIGDYAFYSCDRLKEIYASPLVPPTIYSNTFGVYVNDNATLHVQKECKIAYENAMYWKYFVNVLEDIIYTSIENITTDTTDTTTEYYDLNGRHLKQPKQSNGIYITKRGNIIKKVVM